MFLKFLDDLETMQADEAVLAGVPYHDLLEPPYRWRDWAKDSAGITGPDLLTFINDDRCVRPDGTRGAGLFRYLRDLRSDGNGTARRNVISAVFRDLRNHATSGYVLRDVINLIEKIHFNSSEDVQVLGRMYENMLREMRDAAGQNGEFYTPRPIVRFMVDRLDPKLGETVLDPACGTGGFLAAAYDHLKRQADTVEKRDVLQRKSLKGGEASSLPFLLAQMNLLLHGLDAPNIEFGNALRHRLSEIGERDRVEVILSNPPFGGEEEAGMRTTRALTITRRCPPAADRTGRTLRAEPSAEKCRARARAGIPGVARPTRRAACPIGGISRRAVIGGRQSKRSGSCGSVMGGLPHPAPPLHRCTRPAMFKDRRPDFILPCHPVAVRMDSRRCR